jgi:hypothetical protein
MSRLPFRLRAASLGPLLALLLTGCGSSSSSGNGVASKSPNQVLAAAKTAADGAATAHVSGSIVDEGKPISLDLELEAGKGGKGTLTFGGLSVRTIQIKGTVYINGSKAFYTQLAGAKAAQLLQGKWLKAPASDGNFSSLASLTDLDKLIDSTLSAHGTLSSVGMTKINGQRAVGVTDKANGGTLYVASTGVPYPLEIVRSGGRGGKVVFDRWNRAVTLIAPTGAININQLQSGH